jgi:type VII secretion integral membrane protein EccD
VTGADELARVQLLPAAPEQVRVSVLGGRTQLDVALPADLPIAEFLPELARLVESRDADDTRSRDDRRTFWELSRVGGAALMPDDTLRGAGIDGGELLRIAPRRALAPPVLYDDVVDAAARLNRAAYAPWDSVSAAAMAFVGLWLAAGAWAWLLVADALEPHRAIVISGATLAVMLSMGGAALAHRALGQPLAAAAVSLPALVVSVAIGWTVARHFGPYGVAVAAVVLVAFCMLMYRLVGVGRSLYATVLVLMVFGATAAVSWALGGPPQVIAAVVATVAAVSAVALPSLTMRLGRIPVPTVPAPAPEDEPMFFDDPFATAEPPRDDNPQIGSDAMADVDEVWARLRAASALRAGLWAGLAIAAAAGALLLAHIEPGWPALAFALVTATVLALRARKGRTAAERAVVAVPAVVVVLLACTQAIHGEHGLPYAGLGVLAVVGVAAAATGLRLRAAPVSNRVRTAEAYLDYAAVAALVPLAVWVLGWFERPGLW